MFVEPRILEGGEENLRAGVEPLAEDKPDRGRQIFSKCSQGGRGLSAQFLLCERRRGRLKQRFLLNTRSHSVREDKTEFTDLNNTDQVGHSSRVEHFIKFGGQEEMQEVVERVSQEPAEGGDELEGGVREVAEPHGQVLHHAVHPLHGTLLGRSQAQGFQLVQLRKVVPEQYHDYQT